MILFSSPYLPEPADPHALEAEPPIRQEPSTGVLFINLGTPDEATPEAIRRYLKEFLSDPRVIEIPQLLWQPILRLFVLPRRPHALQPRYKDIWWEEGSPLLVASRHQAEGVEQELARRGIAVKAALGMRYGNPSIASAMEQLRDHGCDRILVVPLYPQYAASTTATAVDKVNEYTRRRRNQPEMRFIKRFPADPGYIASLVESARAHWAEHGKPERLLLSFHGIPKVTVEKGDPYHRDCMETVRALRQALGPDGSLVHHSFQSRFGKQEWLQPYTEPTLREWAKAGVRRVDAMCPGFLADCLETLEEIQIECRDAFIEEGGESLRYIPCLNGNPTWVKALADIVQRHLWSQNFPHHS
ncbi:MAG TPA: ferrochelatase [Burkholderiaceae bacterium]|nr:ferrochelatase [Burkholderiaceae bacterium]